MTTLTTSRRFLAMVEVIVLDGVAPSQWGDSIAAWTRAGRAMLSGMNPRYQREHWAEMAPTPDAAAEARMAAYEGQALG